MLREEAGNAIAEMAILLPLYIVMTYGMFFMGEIGVAQILAQKAARCAAWSPDSPGEAKSHFDSYSFFSSNPPGVSVSAQNVDLFPSSYVSRMLSESGYSLKSYSGGKTQDLLVRVLNGIGDEAIFRRSEATITFEFVPAGLGRLGTVKVQAYHVVDLPTFAERSTQPRSGDLRHAIEEVGKLLGN